MSGCSYRIHEKAGPGKRVLAARGNYAYDSMGRLTGASDVEGSTAGGGCTPWNGATAWANNGSYNAAGQLTGLQLLSGVTVACAGTVETSFNEAWQYNALNQISEIDTSAQSNGYPAGSPTPGLASYFFERYHFSATQNNGQIQSADDARLSASNTYTYDLLKRLTATTGTQSQTFAYDGFGNLTAKSVPAGSAEPVFPGVNSAKNRLNGATYDNNGNVTAFNGYGLSYDMENRLVSATTGSSTETYKYDAANHRVERITASGYDFVYFYGPNGKVLAEFQVLLQPGVSYYSSLIYEDVYFGGMLVGTTGGYAGSEHSSLVDRLGTGHPGYAYGTDIGTATGSGVMDFATYLNDSMTGFLYADQRWYSAGYGRFLTADLSDANVDYGAPMSWNRAAYTNDDPINHLDPMGLGPCSDGTESDFCVTGYGFGDPVNDPTGSARGGAGGGAGSLPSVPGPIRFRQIATPVKAPQKLNVWSLQDQKKLLANAISLALKYLMKADCAALFGSAATRSGNWNPTPVFTEVYGNGTSSSTSSNINGFEVGSIISPIIPAINASAVTITNRRFGLFGANVGSAVWINGPSFVSDVNRFGDFGNQYNADVLLHELGHVYDDASAFGSGGSAVQPDAGNSTASGDNSLMVGNHCY